jgi:hypothetical protein
MGSDRPVNFIPHVWHEAHKARARWSLQRAWKRFANLDREPLPPNVPDASPVEAWSRKAG